MNYTELKIGEKTYKLKLTTRTAIALEKALGYNPLQMFYDLDDNVMPKLTDMVIMMNSMLTTYQHGIDMNDIYDMFDDYFADGNTLMDLIPTYIEVLQNCGFISKAEEIEDGEEPKN